MKKQLLALATSFALISSSAFAASVVVSSNGNPVSNNLNGVVTSGTGQTEYTPAKTVKAAPYKPAKYVKPAAKPVAKKPVKKAPAKKVVKKVEAKKVVAPVETSITQPVAPVVAPVAAPAPVFVQQPITQPVTAPATH